MKTVLFLLFAVVGVLDGYKKACPKPTDIQTEFVAKHFDMKKFEGVWYELAFHDLTQPIGMCGCQRSEKSYSAKDKKIYEEFSLSCYNRTYNSAVSYNVTSTPGFFNGHWPLLPSTVFPDTVVAVGLDNTTNTWRWVIEFQCVQMPRTEHIIFVGIEFYHRKNKVAKSELKEMFAVARKQGLDKYMDAGFGVTILDHSNCTYPSGSEKQKRNMRRFLQL